MVRIAIFAGALIVSLPALAQDNPAPAPATAPVPEKKICRMITPTGSIMAKRFCLTRSEWRQFNGVAGDNAESMLEARRTRPSKDNGLGMD